MYKVFKLIKNFLLISMNYIFLQYNFDLRNKTFFSGKSNLNLVNMGNDFQESWSRVCKIQKTSCIFSSSYLWKWMPCKSKAIYA